LGQGLRESAQGHRRENCAPRRGGTARQNAHGVREDLQVLFAALAMQGTEDEQAMRRAYDAGMSVMLTGDIRPPLVKLGHWPPRLDESLARIDRLNPPAKAELVKALVLTIAHDQKMTVAESELLRAICAVLHCPLPPLYAAMP